MKTTHISITLQPCNNGDRSSGDAEYELLHIEALRGEGITAIAARCERISRLLLGMVLIELAAEKEGD